MVRHDAHRQVASYVVGLCAAIALIAAACAPAPPPAAQPAKPAAETKPAAPAAAPAPAPAPAQPAAKPAQPAKPAAQPAKPAASGAPDQALIEAAKKEGKVVWYTSIDLGLAKTLGDAFQKQHGVPVEIVRSGAERLFTQFMQEQGANVKKADIILTSDASQFLTMRGEGRSAPYRPRAFEAFNPLLKAQLAKVIDPSDHFFPPGFSLFSIVYNPTKVKDADAPKGWKDLLEPRWKGKLVHAHPGYSGFVVTSMHVLGPVLGADYYKQLAKNEPLIVQSADDVTNRVVAGERDVGAGTVHSTAFWSLQKGNPIKIAVPVEGAPVVPYVQALVKDAPHPNAGKLLLEFLLSREGQEIWAAEGRVHVVRGDVKLPEGQAQVDRIKLLLGDPAEIQKAREGLQKMFKETFGV
ncbi:MAG: extracellular solute-binding protein [Chloroflexi bacterium]|nr:extracellular solute-binding protein [Chloroflexota bacterium]